jgi:alkylhydroperoxidase family enzyme
MGYIDFQARVVDPLAGQPRATRSLSRSPCAALSALEWSVVALARGDLLSSLRQPGRLAVAMGGLFGTHHNPRLADPRLEALRRAAVLIWHQGAGLRDEDLDAFVQAGFTSGQYRLVATSINRWRSPLASNGRR